MSAISDAGIVGLTLCLLLGAVAYYLYSRISQLERKVGLMENILLDLKVTTEQTLMSVGDSDDEKPQNVLVQSTFINDHQHNSESNVSQEDTFLPVSSNLSDVKEVKVEEQVRQKAPTPMIQVERDIPFVPSSSVTTNTNSSSVHVNYEAMTYKELVILARQHSIPGTRSMTKAQLIDALKGKSTEKEDLYVPNNQSQSQTQTQSVINSDEKILSLEEVNDNFGNLHDNEVDISFVQSS